jgi:Xaa-Pro aminopeptidase
MSGDLINSEIAIKHERVSKLLERKRIEGLLMAKSSNFKWFSCGGSNDVIKNNDSSLVYLFVTGNKRYLIATGSDGYRIMEEELKGLDFELVLYDWYNETFYDALKKIGVKKVGADFDTESVLFLEEEIAKIRTELTGSEIERYKVMCREYTNIFTDYCLTIKPGLTEIEVAAGLSYQCARKGINFAVLMVGSDGRLFSYRHPCATNKKIDKYVFIATVAERNGLCVNFTRSIYFGKTPDELLKKQDAVNQVESEIQYNARPGITLGKLFEKLKDAYKSAGFPGEWKNHLQGGILGYLPLEFLIIENSDIVLKENNIMGLNPTIQGTKSEDPILVTGSGPIQFSIDDRWPFKEYDIKGESFIRPLIMEIS